MNKPEIVVVRSEKFARYPNIIFGMSTRIGGVSPEPFRMNLSFNVGDDKKNVEVNRLKFFDRLGFTEDRLALPKQIHSNVVKEVTEPGLYPDCDALITNIHNISLAVSVADCVPIFLCDPVTSSIAAVHSGWRGSKARIVSKAIEKLGKQYGALPEHLIGYIGPSAGVCCYEVGEEVASSFDAEFLQTPLGKKPHLDLKLFNKHLMISGGVKGEHIEVSQDCTICHSDLYHSFRRDGHGSGRMFAVIGLREKSGS